MSDKYDHEKTDREALERYGHIDEYGRKRYGAEEPGVELGILIAKALIGKPVRRTRPGTAGFSDELCRLIDRAVELDPALEDLILKIADTAFAEGMEEM